jgi:iron complex outermembrane receptor protein
LAKHFFSFIFLGYMLLVGSQRAYAQSCTVTLEGSVLDENDQPVVAAQLIILGNQQGVITDTTGYFRLHHLCPHTTYTLQITMLGFDSQELLLPVGHQAPPKLQIKLNTSSKTLDEVTVAAQKESDWMSLPQQTLTAEQLAKSSGKPLAEMLKEVSGVSSLTTGASISKPVIHGLYSNRVLILNNGIRQEGQQWGSEHAPEIDPFVASQLTVIKGAASVRYGAEAMGGVILVNPAALPYGMRGSGQATIVGSSNGRQGIFSGWVESGFGKRKQWAARLQATSKNVGTLQSPDYYLANTAFQEFNFSGAVGFKQEKRGIEIFFSRFTTSLGIFRAAHIGNLTDLEAAINSPRPLFEGQFTYDIANPRQKIEHNLLKVNAFYKIPKLGLLQIQYGWQINTRQEFDIRIGGRFNIPALNMELQTHTLELAVERPSSNKWKGSWGLQGLLQFNSNVPGTGVRPLVPNFDNYGIGLFWTEKRVGDKWDWEFGLRYDYRFLSVLRFDTQDNLLNPRFNFQNISASVGAHRHWENGITWRNNIGTAWRPPQAYELYSQGLHHGAAALEFGDENLRAEQAYQTSSTWQVQRKRIDIEIGLYANYINNYIFLNPELPPALTIRGAFPVFNFRQTDALLAGVDLIAKYRFVKVGFVQAKAALIRARDVRNQRFLPFIPADRYEVTAGCQWEEVGQWQDIIAAFTLQHVLQQFRVEPNSDYAPPPPTYTLLNFQAGVTKQWNGHRLAFSFMVENILNIRYRDYMNRFRYFGDEIGRNFTVRLLWTFGQKAKK